MWRTDGRAVTGASREEAHHDDTMLTMDTMNDNGSPQRRRGERLAARRMGREPGLTKQPSIPFVGQPRAARRIVRSNDASARAVPLPHHRPGGLVGYARAVSPEWADACRSS